MEWKLAMLRFSAFFTNNSEICEEEAGGYTINIPLGSRRRIAVFLLGEGPTMSYSDEHIVTVSLRDDTQDDSLVASVDIEWGHDPGVLYAIWQLIRHPETFGAGFAMFSPPIP
jgi:hypothetical protein